MERLGRVVGIVTVPLVVLGVATSLVLRLSLPVTQGNLAEGLLLFTGFGGFAVVGAILVYRVPHNPISWIIVAIGLTVGVLPPLEMLSGYAAVTTRGPVPWWGVIGAWFNAWYWMPLLTMVFILLPMLFPTGHLPSRRWRWVVWMATASMVAFVAIGATQPWLQGQEVAYVIRNPIGVAAIGHAETGPLAGVLFGLFTVGVLASPIAVFVRYRRSRGVERQQLKWFLAAIATSFVLPVGDLIPYVGDALFAVVLITLPVAIGLAILRYRLYEIDRIVSRAVTYALVTGVLVGIYALLILGATSLLGPDDASDLVVAASTLAVAALFRPLHRRIGEAVDRRFHRARYDARRTAEAFGARLRDEVDLAMLREDLHGTVTATLAPRSVSLWLP